jgi:hypothetical protein
MNIQLSGAVEFIDHKETGTLGQVLIRYFWGIARDVEICMACANNGIQVQ